MPARQCDSAVVGEVYEFLASMFTARESGAGKRPTREAFIGGVVGLFACTIPVPLACTAPGAVFGCFAGAVIDELTTSNDLRKGVRVDKAAAISYVLSRACKTANAFSWLGSSRETP